MSYVTTSSLWANLAAVSSRVTTNSTNQLLTTPIKRFAECPLYIWSSSSWRSDGVLETIIIRGVFKHRLEAFFPRLLAEHFDGQPRVTSRA